MPRDPCDNARMGRALVVAALVAFGCGGKSPSPEQADGGDARGDARVDGDARTGQSWWRPSPGTTWQWQLSGAIDTSVDVAMYDVDLEAPEAVFRALRAAGRVIVCYVSVGTHEKARTDNRGVPPAAIGAQLEDWPDERWYDIRHPSVRALVEARFNRARARGCDGVEPDNVDAYANDSGFALSATDQLDFNRFVARAAHARGLSVGLKNDLAQVPELVDDFDWALDEECHAFGECDALLPFIAAGKAVFHVEYGDSGLAAQVCPAANRRNFDTLIKRVDLDAWRVACR